jgi:uncharacterized protein YbaR (Trm112 family)
MRLRLLDILVCPDDKNWPLKLVILNKKVEEEVPEFWVDPETGVHCQYYCAFKDFYLTIEDGETSKEKKEIAEKVTQQDCEQCHKEVITEGVILCQKEGCKRWYALFDGIPSMLPSDLRDEEEEEFFITKWGNELAKKGVQLKEEKYELI